MFALVVRFEVLEDHLAAFDALVAETLAGISANEPDTVIYVSHGRPDRSSERVFYECYLDDEAFNAHEASEPTRRFLLERQEHLAGDPEVWRLSSTDGVIAGRRVGRDVAGG